MNIFDINFFFFNLLNIYYYKVDYNLFNVWLITPEIMFCSLCVLIIFLISLDFKITKIYDLIISLLFLILLLYCSIVIFANINGVPDLKFLFSNFWLFDFYSLFFKILILILSITVLFFSKHIIYILRNQLLYEFLLLFLFSIFFMLILFSSNDFFFSYLALEGMSFSLYILAGSVYYNKLSLESALKYFILGGIASCLLLYGISLLFISVNSLDFFSVKYYLINSVSGFERFDLIFITLCFSLTFFFKLSAFPCFMWSPDVYEGIWTPITAYFSIVVKTTIFGFFLRVFVYVFSSLFHIWQPIFMISAVGSIIIGCFGAMLQRRIKRFLAYTSINQVGFLLLGISMCDIHGISSSILFLIIYLIMTILFFILVLNVRHFTANVQLLYLNDLYSLAQYNLLFGNVWVWTIFSMIGIPPLAGFFTKLFILSSILNQSFYWIILIVLVFSTLSGYYYLNFIKYILFEKKKLINLFFLDIDYRSLLFWLIIFLFLILLLFIFLFPIISNVIMKVSFSCLFKFSSLII